MKYLVLLLLPLALFATFGAVPAANAAPRIEIVGGEVIDLGRGRPGRFVRELAITNAGSDTLRIVAIGSGCGCLAGEPDRRALGPGDTAHVQVTVETTGQVVEQWQKALTITTNDPRRPSVDVTVRASFRHDLRVHTLLNTVERTRCAGGCTWVVELENISDSAVVVQAPILEEMRGVRVELDMAAPRTLAPGERLAITGRITLLGGEEIPTARLLLLSSSAFDTETRVAWFNAPETK